MRGPSFYQRYKLFLGSNPALEAYLRWVYRVTLSDLRRLGVAPVFERALLCGTSGEVTSSVFTEHILTQAPGAELTILDAQPEPIEASAAALAASHPGAELRFVVADAGRTGLATGSIDFIDTDFLFVYLDAAALDRVLGEWRRLLSPRGTIAFRTFATASPLSSAGSGLMNLWCRYGLGAPAYSHSREALEGALSRHGFRALFAGRAFLPFGHRVVASLDVELPK